MYAFLHLSALGEGTDTALPSRIIPVFERQKAVAGLLQLTVSHMESNQRNVHVSVHHITSNTNTEVTEIMPEDAQGPSPNTESHTVAYSDKNVEDTAAILDATSLMNKAVAKRDFGSFHSSNVEELIHLPEGDYQPPELPFKCPTFDKYRTKLPQFGREIRKLHFLLEEKCTFLNHGAFGGVLKEVLTASQESQIYAERQPLRFYDRELLPLLVHVNRRLAAFVGCSPEDVVLMTNATTALNTVIKSIPFKPGDKIFCLSVTYGAVKKLLNWVCEQTGAVLQEVKVKFPIRNREEVVDYVREHLQEETKLAVFDHIPSNTPFILPLEDIIPICKTRNVPVLIDGAHALGVLSLNLHSLQPDYYVSNAHKWFCCPKGSAFLYVQREFKDRIHPLIVSHGFGSGFHSEFLWTGLHDYSPYLAMHVVLNFWEVVGAENIKTYMYDLCRKAGRLLCEMWGTSLAAPEDMFGSMCLVGLPCGVYSNAMKVDYSTAERVQNELYHKYNIEVPIKCIDGMLYVRISAHIYNEVGEYKKLGHAMLEIKLSE